MTKITRKKNHLAELFGFGRNAKISKREFANTGRLLEIPKL